MESVSNSINGLKEVIADLANNDKPLLSSQLAELSNLVSGQIGYFQQVWISLESSRRYKIITQMVELAESNIELNFDSIFKLALNDADPEIRTKAIEGLWENEEPAQIKPLVKILNEDVSEKVQAAAATALGKFAMLAELKKLRPFYTSMVTESLLAVIADKNRPEDVRRRALEAAAPLSLPQIKEAINQAYGNHDASLKASAVFAMGRSCDPDWLPILLKEMENSNAQIRYEAVNACGELCDKEAVPRLLILVDDHDTEVQLAAIQALGKIGGPKAKRCLQKCLDSMDDSVCQAAEEALQQLAAEDSFSL